MYILVKRTTTYKEDAEGLNYLVREWSHNTDTGLDEGPLFDKVADDPGAFLPPAGMLLGSYCELSNRIDVYVSVAADGTTRLESTVDEVACPFVPPGGGGDEPPPSGNTGEGLQNDPYAPAGARLLTRFCKTFPQAGQPDSYGHQDRYYDPATRSLVLITRLEPVFQSCTAYAIGGEELLDQWCVEPGQAPFIERRVYYDAEAFALRYEDVEGITACELPACLFSITAEVTQPGQNSLGTVTLIPQDATGLVTYQLEGSGLPPQQQPTFGDLPAGTHAFIADDADGCTARVTVTLSPDYGIRYRLRYKDARNRTCYALWRKRGYSGPILDVTGDRQAVSVDWPGDGHVFTTLLRGSECATRIYKTDELDYADLYSGDERLWRVEYVIADTLFWRGYLLPEQYRVAHLSGHQAFSTRATDGLGALEGIDFSGAAGQRLTGQWSHLRVLQHCLSRLDLDLPLRVRSELYPTGGTAAVCALEQVSVDVEQYRDDKDKPWSCGKVLTEILSLYQLRVAQQGGALWVERLHDLTIGARRYFAYAPDGAPAGVLNAGRLRTVTVPTAATDPLYWLDASQTKGILPAVRKVEVKADPGDTVNLLQHQAFLDPNAVDANGRPLGWTGTAPVTVLPPAKRDESGILLLPGGAPGLGVLDTDWIQVPLTLPVPAREQLPTDAGRPIRLRITATLRSSEPVPAGQPYYEGPQLIVAVRHGSEWLGGQTGVTTTPQALGMFLYEVGREVTDDFTPMVSEGDTAEPLTVRIYQPVTPQGHARYDVEISAIRLQWAVLGEEESYIDNTITEGPALLTRTDTDTTLFHTDTPGIRKQGTLLTISGYPTSGWWEPAFPVQQRLTQTYFVRDRFLWQQAPAQTLTGTLDGDLRPFDLFTDPQESRPGVYAFTSARYDGVKATWDIDAVQLLTLTAPNGPAGGILTEDGVPVLTQDGQYILTETPATTPGAPTVVTITGRMFSQFTRQTYALGTDRLAGYRPTTASLAQQNSTWSLDQIKAYVLNGFTGGDGGTFTEDIPVSLSNGKTLGKYLSGQTVPAIGKTYQQVLLDIAAESIYPTYTLASVGINQSQPADGEVGESLLNTITGGFNQGDAGAMSGLRLYRNGTQLPNGSSATSPLSVSVQMVRSLTPSGLYAVADYAAGQPKNVPPANTPDDRAPQVRNPNAPQAAETGLQSGVLYYTGYYAVFFGPGSPALGRALAGRATTNQGNQLTLQTGTSETTLSILLPPGKTLQSVTDLDNQNLNLTLKYVAQPPISVPDAGGTLQPGYTPYVLSIATPYTVNARHLFTYA